MATRTACCTTRTSVARVDPTETAFPHREADYNVGIAIGWTDSVDDEAMIGWARSMYEVVLPHSTDGIYANYLEADDDVEDAFAENYDRLVDLKTQWDPTNLFRHTQNVAPSGDP